MNADRAWMDVHEDAEQITVGFHALPESVPNEGEVLEIKVSVRGRTFEKPMRVARVRHVRGYEYAVDLESVRRLR